VAGFGLAILFGTHHEPWRALSYLLTTVGLLAAAGAAAAYPIFATASRAIVAEAGRHEEHGESRAPVPITTAAQLLITELRTVAQSLVRAQQELSVSRNFLLPAQRWDEYRELLAREPDLYAAVSEAYVSIDQINRRVRDRTDAARNAHTIAITPSDQVPQARELVVAAIEALRARVAGGP